MKTRIGTSTEAILALVRTARGCRNRDAMMEYAIALFTNSKRRKVTHNNRTVETWFDPHSQSYVTQYRDEEDCQIGDAEYSGNRESAAFAHLTCLFNLL